MAKKNSNTIMSLPMIINAYNQAGGILLRVENQMNSFADYKGLLTGYTPYIMDNGKPKKLWCCNNSISGITLNNVLTPYTYFNSHQWWMKKNVAFINRSITILKNAKLQQHKFNDFEDLYNYVESLNITKGRLLLYDMTRRIGSCLNIYPQNFVYIHAGSALGAQILQGKGLVNLPNNWKVRVPLNVFANIFPNCDSMDIENMLCIYKNKFSMLP